MPDDEPSPGSAPVPDDRPPSPSGADAPAPGPTNVPPASTPPDDVPPARASPTNVPPARASPASDPASIGSPPAPLPGDGTQEQLSPRAITYWRLHLAIVAVPLAIAVTVAVFFLPIAVGLRVPIAVLAWVLAIATILVVPPIRRRIWWFAIGEEEVDLHHGLLIITRTVVPMVRVQHVDLHRGPLADRMGLAEIELHTAAGSLKIPALDRDRAERIRQQVAVLARVPDDL